MVGSTALMLLDVARMSSVDTAPFEPFVFFVGGMGPLGVPAKKAVKHSWIGVALLADIGDVTGGRHDDDRNTSADV